MIEGDDEPQRPRSRPRAHSSALSLAYGELAYAELAARVETAVHLLTETDIPDPMRVKAAAKVLQAPLSFPISKPE